MFDELNKKLAQRDKEQLQRQAEDLPVGSFMRKAANGPVSVTREFDKTTGVDANGLTIVLEASPIGGAPPLTEGVPIRVNGTLAGHICQESKGWGRAARAIYIEPVEGTTSLPFGHYFRFRPLFQVSLEGPQANWVIKDGWTTKIRPDASEVLVCLFPLVSLSLKKAMTSEFIL